MSDLESGRSAGQPGGNEIDPIQYPTDKVIAVLDTSEQVQCAVDALVDGGFLESEIELNRGGEWADRLASTTGRSGLSDWFIRMFQKVGLKNEETELKEEYEEAVRGGKAVVAVLVPTDERKNLAVRLIRDCGGHFISYYGRLNVERISR